jgi:glycine/D-amino acid oxidase-like deaminating enzyme
MTAPWLQIATLAPQTPLPERADVVVIGAGLAGAAAARFLRDAGTDVLLLEARKQLGAGASGRHLGHYQTGLIEHPYRLVHALGQQGASELFQMSRENHALLADHLTLDQRGGYWVATDEREAAQIALSHHAMLELGLPTDVLSGAAACERLHGAGFGPALCFPGDGSFETEGAVATIAAGVPAVTDYAVDSVVDTADGLEVRSGDRAVRAEAVIYAASTGLVPLHGFFHDKLTPVRETALATAPLSDVLGPAGRAGYGYTFWRQRSDRTLLVGGCRWATPHMEVGESDDGVVASRIQTKLSAFIKRHLPAAADAKVTHRWAWVNAQSCDGLPIVGPLPGAPREIACTGFGANEPGLGMRAARAVADGLLTGTSPGLPAMVATQRFV